MIQAQIQKCRTVQPSAVPPTQPFAGPSSPPHIILSPRTPTNLLTTGFAFFLSAPDVGSSLTVWKQDAASGFWAVLLVVTPPQLAAFFWITVCDVNACPLFFQSDAEGEVGIFIEETGVAPA